MKKLLIAASTAALLGAATLPASADFYAGAGPSGVGVQVGPFGVGVGPRFGWRDHHWRRPALCPWRLLCLWFGRLPHRS